MRNIRLLHDLLLLYIVFELGQIFMEPLSKEPNYISFARIFSIIPINYQKLYPVFYIATILSLFFCILFENKLTRFLVAFQFTTLISLQFSFGSISHMAHVWIWSSIILFLSISVDRVSRELILDTISASLFASYFNSGCWKVRNILSSSDFTYQTFKDISLETIGQSVAGGHSIERPMLKLLIENYDVYPFIFSLVILFQATCFLPIIFKKLRATFLVCALMFHFGAGALLGHWYFHTCLMCLYLLYFTHEDKQKIPLELSRN